MARGKSAVIEGEAVEETFTDPDVAIEEGRPKHRVDYGLTKVDVLPDRPARVASSGRPSVLEHQLELVVGDEDFWYGWVKIATYHNSTAASAARNVLQQRHGRTPSVKGWQFETRRLVDLADEDGVPSGLFVKYDPSLVEDGAWDRHVEFEAARKERLAQAKAAREKAAPEDEDGFEPDDEWEYEETASASVGG